MEFAKASNTFYLNKSTYVNLRWIAIIGQLITILSVQFILKFDFNATSEFSLHSRLRKTLRDVWREAGWGFGATTVFRGVLPLRVDFLYTTPDIRAVRASVGSAECADHRPIIGQLDLL